MAGSLEKTRACVEEILDAKLSAPLAAMAAPMVQLPDTDAELDDQLAQYAALALALRSDDATPMEVVAIEPAAASEA